MNARRIRVSVTYDTTDITEDLAPFLKTVGYTDHMSGQADDLSIALEDRAGLWQSDWMPDKGATLAVTLTQSAWQGEGKEESLDLGTFEIDEIESSGAPSEAVIKAVSVPENNELRGVEKTRSWEAAQLSTIANDVASGAGLTLVYSTESDPLIERAEQTEQSDLSFLQQLCDDQGLALKVFKGQIIIFDEEAYEETAPTIAIVKPGASYTKEDGVLYLTGVTGYRLKSRIRDTYQACQVQYQDAETNATITAEFTDPNKEEGKTLHVKEQVESTSDALRLAKKRLREKNRDEVTGSFDLPGNFALLASNTVRLIGFGAFDGNYIIETASHSVGNGYTTSIDVRRCLIGY